MTGERLSDHAWARPFWRMTKWLWLFIGVISVQACASGGLLAPTSDLERTWTNALVALPPLPSGAARPVGRLGRVLSGADLPVRLGNTPTGAKLPVVLYLHGCTGLGSSSRAFMSWLAGNGYAVIAPDSMARKFRPLQCDPKTKSGGYNLYVYEFRLAEVAYALEQIEKLPWVDLDRLFLVGISEGGVAAALYRGDGFRAHAILQWTCHGGPLVRGIAAPADTPILSVVYARDPWYDPSRTPGQRGHCGAYFGDRKESRSIVLETEEEHSVMDNEQAKDGLIGFLSLFN